MSDGPESPDDLGGAAPLRPPDGLPLGPGRTPVGVYGGPWDGCRLIPPGLVLPLASQGGSYVLERHFWPRQQHTAYAYIWHPATPHSS